MRSLSYSSAVRDHAAAIVHAHQSACMHTHMHTLARARRRSLSYTHTHTHTHTRTSAQTHAHAYPPATGVVLLPGASLPLDSSLDSTVREALIEALANPAPIARLIAVVCAS